MPSSRLVSLRRRSKHQNRIPSSLPAASVSLNETSSNSERSSSLGSTMKWHYTAVSPGQGGSKTKTSSRGSWLSRAGFRDREIIVTASAAWSSSSGKFLFSPSIHGSRLTAVKRCMRRSCRMKRTRRASGHCTNGVCPKETLGMCLTLSRTRAWRKSVVDTLVYSVSCRVRESPAEWRY